MHTSRKRLPVLILATALFVVTTSEFQVAALLNDMASGLHTSPASIGTLVTTYSLGMGLGGPLIAWLLRRMPPKSALIGTIGAYALAEAVAGVSSSMPSLIALRAATGALSGATFGLCMTLGIRLTPRSAQSRASATILTGLMFGTLLGLPISHLVGAVLGWRVSFLILAVAAAVMAMMIFWAVPRPPSVEASTPDHQPVTIDWGLLVRYAGSFLTIGGAFAVFSFIDPILRRGGLGDITSTWALLSFGVAALTINTLSGRVTPGRAWRWLVIGQCVQAGAIVTYLVSEHHVAVVVLATIALGGTGIALNPLLVDRVLTVAAPTVLVNTLHTSAITLGIAAATALGSRAYHTSGDLVSTIWIGLAFTAVAILLTVATPARRTPRPHDRGAST